MIERKYMHRGEEYKVLVDLEDAGILDAHKWRIKPKGNRVDLVRQGRKSTNEPGTVYLHRQVMGVVDAGRFVQVDHINGNPLDCRKQNLRMATIKQNVRNRRATRDIAKTPFRGVKKKSDNAYVSLVVVNGVHIYCGRFRKAEDAALAHDRAALKWHGDFATTNFGGYGVAFHTALSLAQKQNASVSVTWTGNHAVLDVSVEQTNIVHAVIDNEHCLQKHLEYACRFIKEILTKE